MNAAIAIEIACKLAYTVSGFHRYVRVNDYVVDTSELMVVAMAWPKSTDNLPKRHKGDTVGEALS